MHQPFDSVTVIMARDNDAMLVEACLRGDRTAFGTLVDRYEGKLYNAAYRVTGSREDAMDATQTAFVKVYEKLQTFDPAHRFFSWIYRITLNEALNLVNRRRPVLELGADTPGTASIPDEGSGATEISRRVQTALLELTADHRAASVLRHLQGLSYREMGEVLGIPEKTVKSRLFTARQRFRDVLRERGITS